MNNNFFVSIILDIRRCKANGKFPVKLRVFTKYPRKQKLYPTDFDFTEVEFKSIMTSKKPRDKEKKIRMELQSLETKAFKISEQLKTFSFEAFEALLFGENYNHEKEVKYYYDMATAQFDKNNQINTSSSYKLGLNSLLRFHGKKTISFSDITPQWLKSYENYMVELGRSKATVGIYLRPLRAIFNTAIYEKAIDPEQYPFGKRKYTIPAPKAVKKALSKQELQILLDGIPKTLDQEKAKDFFFFSYSCNGINFKDLTNLQYKDISGDILSFRRAKTTNTDIMQAPINVFLTPEVKKIIKKYGNPDKSKNNYIFSLVDHSESAVEQQRQLKNFIRTNNQHFLIYANNLGIDKKISSYWARHSFATIAFQNGVPIDYLSPSMGHKNSNITMSYIGTIESDDVQKDIAAKIMNFKIKS